MLEGCTPWPEEFASRYRQRGYWRGQTVPQAIFEVIARHGSKTAIVYGGRRISYFELGQRVGAMARGLMRHDIKPRERVVLQLPNSPEFLVAFLALQQAGAIPVLALPAHRQAEIGHFIRHAGAVAYIGADIDRGFDFRAMADEILRRETSLAHVFINGAPNPGQVALDALMAADDETPLPEIGAGDIALMLLSGGTTALPKLIPRTHDDYVYNFRQSGAVSGFDDATVYLAILPLAHNFALGSPGILATLAYGGTIVMSAETRADDVFPLIERERISVVCGAVPLAIAWLNSDVPARHDLSSVRLFINGGARLAPELRQRLEEMFSCTYQESFGTAEGLLNQTRLDDPAPIRFESSGRPISEADEIRIVDDEDRDVPDGTPGELICRGPYTIRGYYNAPEINAAAFTEDGFYRTGDMVKRNNGSLYVEGRKKDLINRGGEKISSEEVENLIYTNPKVKGVCVVAMPDAMFGEKACAFLIPRDGETMTFEELVAHLAKCNIAKFKLPERLEIVDTFPTSPAGKILRKDLRKIIADKIAAERAGGGQAGLS